MRGVNVKYSTGLAEERDMSLPSINYQALELEKTAELQEDISRRLAQHKETGRGDSVRNAVLTQVVNSNYEAAIQELQMHVDFRVDYPNFQSRVQRYVDHCSDLIHAIETKRNLPDLGSLSLSKQQELYDRVLDHFEELKSYLSKIEQVERDVKLTDVRSTVWFVKSCMHAAFFILVVGFTIEVVNGLGASFYAVLNEMTVSMTNFVFSLF